MLIGYCRVSKADGSQSVDLQRDALRAAGVDADRIYEDQASGAQERRPGLDACLRALRSGDVLVIWKLDRLGRTLAHLVNTVRDLSDRGIGLKVLTGQGAEIDTTTAAGRMIFGIFATLAEFERDLIRERTVAGLAAARARGRKGGRKFALTKAQVRLARPAHPQTEHFGRSKTMPGAAVSSPCSGARLGDPQSGHASGTPRSSRRIREVAMPIASWINVCAISASSQVADFACVSQLEKVQELSSAPFKAPRRSRLLLPSTMALQMISDHSRKLARCSGVFVQTAASWATPINSSKVSRQRTPTAW
ncbi:recombinase family protein [Cereibacter johrii]|uniref:recombinase family protein n=1 Tax=Cereibacter johrii TaxID=445629 RepID=UPI003CE7EC69